MLTQGGPNIGVYPPLDPGQLLDGRVRPVPRFQASLACIEVPVAILPDNVAASYADRMGPNTPCPISEHQEDKPGFHLTETPEGLTLYPGWKE